MKLTAAASLPPSLRSAAPLHSTNSNSFHTGRLRRHPRLDSPPNTNNDHPSQVFFPDFPGVQDGLPLRAGIFCPIMPITSSTRALIEGRGSRCAQVFSTGLVLDCEFQIVKLSSTLCGTAKGLSLQIQKRQ